METEDDENDLKLIKASANFLSDLQTSLPTLLWKSPRSGPARRRVHRQVRRRDLDYVIRSIEPFQSDPQLLDGTLKYILPPIVDAYIELLSVKDGDRPTQHVPLQSAICTILYTLCKVRGYKVVIGFLNNEPRYLESILDRLEAASQSTTGEENDWQVQYILLLWTAHLMLVPFDLASISPPRETGDTSKLPLIAERVQNIGISMLSFPTKAQDAAAFLLVRLVTRPDMRTHGLCDTIASHLYDKLLGGSLSGEMKSIYEPLGVLRYYAAVSATELEDSVVEIYQNCRTLSMNRESILGDNAVAKKLFIKIFSNTVTLALKLGPNAGTLAKHLQSGLLEDTIDHMLQSLSDRDTPVRYAASKALSRVVLHLDPEMGHEVIEAVLGSFKEDMPRGGQHCNFRTANALRWHGLTLTISHMLFKRSAALTQLSDILAALLSALQFEQRTATGSSVGTNVRDAANFGLWALSRRYTTKELTSVDSSWIGSISSIDTRHSIIQTIATQLVLSACLDPVGNVRRGSSAAFQELVGRHPNQVFEGISMVQIVDYQAVGLRRRAMVDVAAQAANLLPSQEGYWPALVEGLLGWRGVGSPDVLSREATAAAFAKFAALRPGTIDRLMITLVREVLEKSHDIEGLHGILLAIACLLGEAERSDSLQLLLKSRDGPLSEDNKSHILNLIVRATETMGSRVQRSEVLAAVAQLCAALCWYMLAEGSEPSPDVDNLVDRLLTRQEDYIQEHIPGVVAALLRLKRKHDSPCGNIGAQKLSQKVVINGSKSMLNGACAAIALGSLAPLYGDGLKGNGAMSAVSTLAGLTEAANVDWRIVGVKALRFSIAALDDDDVVDEELVGVLMDAVHRGLNDYTIDERGDVGSLVRLQAIACTSCIFEKSALTKSGLTGLLHGDIHRLALEKLDRVRLEAAKCCSTYLSLDEKPTDVASVSSERYFLTTLTPLTQDAPDWKHRALLEGCISCAGISSEGLLEASRSALIQILAAANTQHLGKILTVLAAILKALLPEHNNSLHPALELLAFLLDMQVPQRLANTTFKWRNTLSTIQKAHHKSNDIPKILAAVQVYRGLTDVPSIRGEVMKKLVSMLKTNPYPRIRASVVEVLWVVTREEALKGRDWGKPASTNADVIAQLQDVYVSA